MASAANEVFKGINQLLVTVEVGLRIQRYRRFVVLGNMSCTGGRWVIYIKAGGVLKGLGVLFTVHKTDWL